MSSRATADGSSIGWGVRARRRPDAGPIPLGVRAQEGAQGKALATAVAMETKSADNCPSIARKALLGSRFVVTSALFGVGLWVVGLDIAAYLTYGTTTNVRAELLTSVTFPAVTVCNYNRWKRSQVPRSAYETLRQQMEAQQKATLSEDYEDIVDATDKPTTAQSTVMPEEPPNKPPEAPGVDAASSLPAPPRTAFNLFDFMLMGGWKLKDWESSRAGNGLNATLLRCTFRGVECNSKFFKTIVTTYGLCHTFNQNINWSTLNREQQRLGPQLKQTVSAEDSGLSLVINVEAWDYFESLALRGNAPLGLKIIVHSADRPPRPEGEGISVSPGQHATIPVRWSEHRYMESPWGICNKSTTLQTFANYTQEGCLWECTKMVVQRNCSCVLYSQADSPENVCSPDQSINCAYGTQRAVALFPDAFCNCPYECTRQSYEATAYYATYPNPGMTDDLASQYNVTPGFYRQNVASMSIFFGEISRTVVQQTAATTLQTIWGDIGGHIGLLTGFSCIWFIDFCEFVIERCLRRREQAIAESHVVGRTSVVEPFMERVTSVR